MRSEALQAALEARKKYPTPRQDLFVIVDYGRSKRVPRLHVVDSSNNSIIREFLVAHGTGSGKGEATMFSNVVNAHMSSLGAMKTGDTYHGKYGRSLKLHGLEKGVNDNVFARFIVVHGSLYVTNKFVGNSWGCLAVPMKEAQDLIDMIKGGVLVYAHF